MKKRKNKKDMTEEKNVNETGKKMEKGKRRKRRRRRDEEEGEEEEEEEDIRAARAYNITCIQTCVQLCSADICIRNYIFNKYGECPKNTKRTKNGTMYNATIALWCIFIRKPCPRTPRRTPSPHSQSLVTRYCIMLLFIDKVLQHIPQTSRLLSVLPY
jgi:hypothetical protein